MSAVSVEGRCRRSVSKGDVYVPYATYVLYATYAQPLWEVRPPLSGGTEGGTGAGG